MNTLASSYHFDDFTTSEYAKLIKIAQRSYKFTRYEDINVSERFILWRHDCDYSLNRSLHLAKIDSSAGISSTFFLNPHSEFYNVLEKSQVKIVQEIIALGHDIGLHFDAAFYDIHDEKQLSEYIAIEADWLRQWFDVQVAVFSFHNPTPLLLSFEEPKYSGLINCYSYYFKKEVGYCSDSNGYWRYRRLRDVLEIASDRSLQVLTHPAWWQEKPLSPRNRILRSVEGRANATMQNYDDFLAANDRKNIS